MDRKWLKIAFSIAKWLKIAFSIANCRFRLPIHNLKHCFNTFGFLLPITRHSSRLPPIQCDFVVTAKCLSCLLWPDIRVQLSEHMFVHFFLLPFNDQRCTTDSLDHGYQHCL